MGCSSERSDGKMELVVSRTKGRCAIGEEAGDRRMRDGAIPVLSCEGACIRGEIARLAANYLSKERGFARGCHGKLLTVPDSKIAKWIGSAPKVICIEGCFLKCQSRILENILEPSRLLIFDAQSHHKRYDEVFDIEDVPEAERKEVGQTIAQWVSAAYKE
jgi:uncharacterized metal-binding protein